MTSDEIRDVLAHIRFGDWTFAIGDDAGRPFLQLGFVAPDADTGIPTPWKSRKWFLSEHMTVSEIVGTAFKAVMTAVEHEAREAFKFHGRAVYGPHIDVWALYSVAGQLDARPTPALAALRESG